MDRSKRKTLIVAYAAFLTLGLPACLLGVAWPTMRAEFSLQLDAMGLVLVSSTVGYTIASFLIARLISRFGICSLLLVGSLTSALTMFGYALAPAWLIFVGMSALSGFGAGIIDAGLNAYLAAEHTESEMQWLHAAFGLGATLSPIIITVSLSRFDSWRAGYMFVGVILLILAWAFWLSRTTWRSAKGPPQTVRGNLEADRSLIDYKTSIYESMLHPQTIVGVFLVLLYAGAEFTMGNWTYILLTEGRGISPQMAGICAGGFWGVFTVGRILGGLFAHRFSLNSLMLSSMTLALVGAVLLWLNPIPLVGVAGVCLLGFALAPIFAGLVSSTSQRVGAAHAANAIGIQVAAANIGGALLPAYGGYLAQRFSLVAIPVMIVVCIFGLLLLYLYSIVARG